MKWFEMIEIYNKMMDIDDAGLNFSVNLTSIHCFYQSLKILT